MLPRMRPLGNEDRLARAHRSAHEDHLLIGPVVEKLLQPRAADRERRHGWRGAASDRARSMGRSPRRMPVQPGRRAATSGTRLLLHGGLLHLWLFLPHRGPGAGSPNAEVVLHAVVALIIPAEGRTVIGHSTRPRGDI